MTTTKPVTGAERRFENKAIGAVRTLFYSARADGWHTVALHDARRPGAAGPFAIRCRTIEAARQRWADLQSALKAEGFVAV